MLRTRLRAGPAAGLVISLLFACILTLIQTGDRYISAWRPVLDQPAPVTLRVPFGPRMIRDPASKRAFLHYQHQRAVVPMGTRLNPQLEAHWTAYVYETQQRPPRWPRLVGVFVIFFTLSTGLTAYLRKFGQNRLKLLRVQAGLIAMLALQAVLAKGLLLFTSLPEFWIPMAAVPLWVALSFDRRTAFVVAVVLSFVMASLLSFDLVLLSVLLARGMAATLFHLDKKRTLQMVTSGLLAGLSAAALYVAIMVTFEGRFDILGDLRAPLESTLLGCVGGGLIAGALGALFRAQAQRVLGNVPRERLMDLQDLSQPLMLKLAQDAPGTFEHSRAMANLAEQASSAIGADALLTRAGAYYHDLGKTAQSKYFVENLGPDERSPHEDLDPEVSADAIMAHVVLGTKLCREGGIPEPVAEFCYTHHGTQLVEYFWNKCQEQGNPKELDESQFRYPGMVPQTKETAILMLVDSIEAASRTIDPPRRDQFEMMIQRIIFTKLKAGQLDECGLDLNDLRIITNRMADTLVNMHHHRIKYHWQAKQAEEFGVPSEAVRDSAPVIEVGKSTLRPPDAEAIEAEQRASGSDVPAPLPEVAPATSAQFPSGWKSTLKSAHDEAELNEQPPAVEVVEAIDREAETHRTDAAPAEPLDPADSATKLSQQATRPSGAIQPARVVDLGKTRPTAPPTEPKNK